jgi:hypothetical protein
VIQVKLNQEEIAKRIQQCLKEAGVETKITLSEHEAVVHGRVDGEDPELRVIAQISDRDLLPSAHGLVSHEIARARLSSAVIRPSLASRSAGKKNMDTLATQQPFRHKSES